MDIRSCYGQKRDDMTYMIWVISNCLTKSNFKSNIADLSLCRFARFVLKSGDFKSQTKHFRKGRVAQLIHESTKVHRPDMFAVSWQGEVRNDFCLNNICVGNWLSSFFNTWYVYLGRPIFSYTCHMLVYRYRHLEYFPMVFSCHCGGWDLATGWELGALQWSASNKGGTGRAGDRVQLAPWPFVWCVPLWKRFKYVLNIITGLGILWIYGT